MNIRRNNLAVACAALCVCATACGQLQGSAPGPVWETIRVELAPNPFTELANALFPAALVGGMASFGVLLIASIARKGGRYRAASEFARAGVVLVPAFGSAIVMAAAVSTVLRQDTGIETSMIMACAAVLLAGAAIACVRLIASPLPHGAPCCARCGQQSTRGQARCPECGLESGARMPIFAQPWAAVWVGTRAGMLLLGLTLGLVQLVRPGAWPCVAQVEIESFERESIRRPGQLARAPRSSFAATVTTSIERPRMGWTPSTPLRPTERFTAEVAWTPMLGAASGVPAARFESWVDRGSVEPPRAEYDAAVSREIARIVQRLAKGEREGPEVRPTGEAFDAADAQRVLADFASILRDRLERAASGEAWPDSADGSRPNWRSDPPSISSLQTKVVRLTPPWWAVCATLLAGLAPVAVALRGRSAPIAPRVERWILGEPRESAH